MKNNFYLFYGEDKSLIKKEIDFLKDKLSIDDNDVINYEIEDIDDIVNEASTISMFSSNKFIIIDATNYFGNKIDIENVALLEKYFDNYNPDSYLVFVSYSNDIDGRKKLVKLIISSGICKKIELNDDYIKKYISDYLKENDFQMDGMSLSIFMSRCGNNINNITNELDKLILYKYDEKIINKDDVFKLVSENIDDNVYELVKCILKNEKNKAMKLYNNFVINGMDASQIIAVISSQIRLLYQTKKLHNNGKSNNEIAKILEFKNVYRVKYLLSDAYYYDENMLCKYLYKLAIIDKKIKYGTSNGNILLELFIAEKGYVNYIPFFILESIIFFSSLVLFCQSNSNKTPSPIKGSSSCDSIDSSIEVFMFSMLSFLKLLIIYFLTSIFSILSPFILLYFFIFLYVEK